MIPKVNLGVGQMEFMFCDFISFSELTLRPGINLTNLPCLTSVLAGGTSDSRNSSHIL